MFGWFKRKTAVAPPRVFETLGVDIHAHWLPGIDDGAKSVEESIALLQRAYELGLTTVVATPHVYKEYYPNTQQTIQTSATTLKNALKTHELPVTLHVAAEYYLDEHFEALLAHGDLLTFGNSHHVLVEQGFVGPTPNLFELMYQIQLKGMQPILAHPERYVYYWEEKNVLEDLHDRGVLFQLNLLSLTGHYGKVAKELGLWLAKQGMIDLVGTDTHRMEHLEKISGLAGDRHWKMLLDTGVAERQKSIFN